jgi:tetratricopeptide (TPR) repeat protein
VGDTARQSSFPIPHSPFPIPESFPILKVSDFGLAKRFTAEPHSPLQGPLTTPGAIMGTPSYMAPEQASGVALHLGPAVDVYALGAILYECLTGRPPFLAEGPLETILQVLQQDPVPPRALAPACPRDLEIICLKCLHKQPGRRYDSAAGLAEDLARFLEGRPIQARPVRAWERAAKWARRRPTQAALLAVCALAFVLGALGVGWHQHQLSRANTDLARALNDRGQALRDEARQRERNAQLLHLAMDSMSQYGGIVDKEAEKHSNLPGLRAKLAEGRLPFYEAFLKQAPTDPEMRYRAGFARLELGIIRFKTKEVKKAEDHFHQASELFAGLLEDFPDNEDYRRQRARVEAQRGLFSFGLERPGDAERAFRNVLELQEGLKKRGAQTDADRREVNQALYYLGSLAHQAGRYREAGAFWEQYVARARARLRRSPEDAQALFDLATGLGQLGDMDRHRAGLALCGAPAAGLLSGRAWQQLALLPAGQAYARSARPLLSEAVEHQRKALRLGPTHTGIQRRFPRRENR